jgi:MscS family membrane protein
MLSLQLLFHWPVWFRQSLWGNPLIEYLEAVIIILLGFLLKRLFSSFIFWLTNISTPSWLYINDIIAFLRQPFEWISVLLIFYFAFDKLAPPSFIKNTQAFKTVIHNIFMVILTISIIWFLTALVSLITDARIKNLSEDQKIREQQYLRFVSSVIKIIIVLTGVFWALAAIFKVNVSTFLTGLGISGVAVALAAKDTIENLLGFMAIIWDKPFQVGNYIKIGAQEGVVETIGLRSTRVRTLENTIVSIPNKRIIDQDVDNFSRREMRRLKVSFLADPDSPGFDSLESTLAILREEIRKHPQTIHPEETVVIVDGLSKDGVEILVSTYLKYGEYREYVIYKNEILQNFIKKLREAGIRMVLSGQPSRLGPGF